MARPGVPDAKPPGIGDPEPAATEDEEIAYLAKRHRVSPAVVREIVRQIGTVERSAVEREIVKGKARR